MNQAGKLLKPSYFKRSEETDEESKEQDRNQAENILDQMIKHEINLDCTSYKTANYDIVVDGLGWISVQGKGSVTFMLYLPEGIAYHIRDTPMRPFEVNDRKLKRYTGNTINARTRKNREKSPKKK